MYKSKKRKGLFVSLDHTIGNDILSGLNTSNGIVKKIVSQIRCFEEYGYEMEVLSPYQSRNPRIHSIVRRMPFSGIIPYGKDIVRRADSFDFIYVRSPWFMNSDTPRFLRQLKRANPKIKIVFEVPTYDSSGAGGEINHWHMWPLHWKNANAVAKLVSCVDRIVTFSRDDVIYGIKTVCTSNAIDPSAVKPVIHTEDKSKRIHLVACSSMAFWHGFDRVIEGMNQYFRQNSPTYDVVFHVIGDGEELLNYKAMVQQYGLGEKVIFYGYRSGQELDTIYNYADIAIDSMGRHRSKVYYNSSLKGKEYLAKGLPVVSGVTNELDSDPSFPYYLRVPADDTPVDVNKLVAFYEKTYLGNRDRAEIVHAISTYATDHFAYKVALKPVVDFIQG